MERKYQHAWSGDRLISVQTELSRYIVKRAVSQIRSRMRRFFFARTTLLAAHRSLRIGSLLAPRPRKKSLAAHVSVFVKRPTKVGIEPQDILANITRLGEP